jgi:hypothetical protein
LRQFHVGWNFSLDENRLEAEATSCGLKFAIFQPRHAESIRLIQRSKNWVRREYPFENLRRAIQPDWLSLSQRKQAGDVIEFSVGKQHRVDG